MVTQQPVCPWIFLLLQLNTSLSNELKWNSAPRRVLKMKKLIHKNKLNKGLVYNLDKSLKAFSNICCFQYKENCNQLEQFFLSVTGIKPLISLIFILCIDLSVFKVRGCLNLGLCQYFKYRMYVTPLSYKDSHVWVSHQRQVSCLMSGGITCVHFILLYLDKDALLH